MIPRLSLILALAAPGMALAQGAIAGTVIGTDGKPLETVQVVARRATGDAVRDATTDERGAFRLSDLTPGAYVVSARRVGYRNAEVSGIRVSDGQTTALVVTLTQAPRQLSTIEIVASPTAVSAKTPELPTRLDRTVTELLPSARDASSLIALVPGARAAQLWGGAPGVSNDYRLDGVSMNHPGSGGDFLGLSVDWIETLEVRGLGAGAESGNFQGGLINAITRRGGNERRAALRTNYESPRLTATNLNANEIGSEQAGRREVAGELLGPVLRDRLFYFVAGQFVDRDVRAPNLVTSVPGDFQAIQEAHLNARGLAKFTWLPAAGQRVDALAGFSYVDAQNVGLNGVDDASATHRELNPSRYFQIAWTNSSHARSAFDVRVAGFAARETSLGYGGPKLPAVQTLQLGRMPTYQNAAFDERREPSSLTGIGTWRTSWRVLQSDHELVLGAEVSQGRWRESRIRNGGLTWRPYTYALGNFDPTDATTWGTVGSDWGGEMNLDSKVGNRAVFAQHSIHIGDRVTLTPGLRFGRWFGELNPSCATCDIDVWASGYDPRIGISVDPFGRNTLALKAHWGRYHQGMFALFFDRISDVEVYTNHRFYYSAPPLTDGTKTYTPGQRDAYGSGFSTFYDETILNEAGRVSGYRQPYVDQAVLGVEKSIGASWKAELLYTRRSNHDIVGLVDRNLATNYSPVKRVYVDHRFVSGWISDANGNALQLPVVYVANKDLKRMLFSCGDTQTSACSQPIAGYTAAQAAALTWLPDLELTTVPQARREYGQFTMLLRANYPRVRGEASFTTSHLRGNVPGVTGYGTTGTRFSAGPFVHPNEAINADGYLPDGQQLEAKLWVTARLPWSLQAGALFSHVYREMFAPTFAFNGRYVYSDSLRNPFPTDLFRSLMGQSVFVEPRGSRFYPSRDVLDLHVEWTPRGRVAVAMDLFNATGCDAITLINTNIGDRTETDPTSFFGATRLRAAPRTLRLGASYRN